MQDEGDATVLPTHSSVHPINGVSNAGPYGYPDQEIWTTRRKNCLIRAALANSI